MLVFDQEPFKGNVRIEEIDDPNGMNFKMQSRIGEDFVVNVPITGEKAKVRSFKL